MKEKMKSEVVDYYDSIATTYDESRFDNSYGRFIDAEERRAMDLLMEGQRTDGLRLDMACGTGRLTNYATHGLDASAEMMKLARQRHPSVTFKQASANETGFPDKMFDMVYSFHLMMHLEPATISEIFKEVHRILKPGGRFIMDIPSKKRRQLLHHRQASWHGGTEMAQEEMQKMAEGLFTMQRTFGVMLLPLHRLPEGIRWPLLKFDYAMANGWLKAYSSYLIYEFVKQDKG